MKYLFRLFVAILVLSSTALNLTAQNSILIIYDDSPTNTNTLALKAGLEAAGNTVTISSVNETAWNNTNPSLSGFDVVIRLNGTTYGTQITTAGQNALVDFVENNNGAYVQFEWDAYQYGGGSMQLMEDLILLERVSGSTATMTLTEVSAQSNHPILTGVPTSFNLPSGGHNVGTKRVYSTDTSIVLMTHGTNDAVVYRDFGSGCVLGFHNGGNYNSSAILSDSNIIRLISNFTNHCAYCGIDATTFSTGVSCFGDQDGVAGVSTSGGVPPYNFEWNTGSSDTAITGLLAGVYTVTISDSGGCVTQKQIVVASPTEIALTTTTVNSVLCHGNYDGAAAVTVEGGTPPFTYIWNNGATTDTVLDFYAGLAIVTVTDSNGCQFIDTTEVLSPDEITVSFNVTPVDCESDDDGQLVASASGGVPPHSYTWSTGNVNNSVNNLPFGVYDITVTDNAGCTIVDSVAVYAQYLSPVVDLGDDLDICVDWPVKVSAENPGSSYNWSTGSPAQYIYVSAAGTYWVEVTNDSGCVSADTIEVETHSCVGVTEISGIENVEIYPNPTDGLISIFVEDISLVEAVYTVYDVKGRRVDDGFISKLNAGSSLQIQLDEIPSGSYVFELKSEAHLSRHALIVK